jgi:regulator of replication initiation timing
MSVEEKQTSPRWSGLITNLREAVAALEAENARLRREVAELRAELGAMQLAIEKVTEGITEKGGAPCSTSR